MEKASDPSVMQRQKALCLCYRIKLRVEPALYMAPSYLLKPNLKTAEMRPSQLALDQELNTNVFCLASTFLHQRSIDKGYKIFTFCPECPSPSLFPRSLIRNLAAQRIPGPFLSAAFSTFNIQPYFRLCKMFALLLEPTTSLMKNQRKNSCETPLLHILL